MFNTKKKMLKGHMNFACSRLNDAVRQERAVTLIRYSALMTLEDKTWDKEALERALSFCRKIVSGSPELITHMMDLVTTLRVLKKNMLSRDSELCIEGMLTQTDFDVDMLIELRNELDKAKEQYNNYQPWWKCFLKK